MTGQKKLELSVLENKGLTLFDFKSYYKVRAIERVLKKG